MPRPLAAVALGLSAILWLAAPADARWGSSSSGPGTARSTTIAAPGTVSASCGLLLDATVKVDWAPSPSAFVAQYEVLWGTSAAPTANSNLVTGTTFTTPVLGLGTWQFTVRSAKGSWRSASSNTVQKGITRILFVATCT